MKTVIIIGLGNPGEQYKNTRHNVGFRTVDLFKEENDFPDFELQKKTDALISEQKGVLLAKPQTFMNNSGKAVKKIIKNMQARNIIIIHDDADLPVGKIKIVQERGSAGHKGVESVIKNIGNKGLIRIRIGIAGKKDMEAGKMVLKNFSEQETPLIKKSIKNSCLAINVIINNGIEKAMNEYNK